MANPQHVAVMTGLAHEYARTLLSDTAGGQDDALIEKLKDVIRGNGAGLIPGASLLGFSSSFVVLPDTVNETSRDLYLGSIARMMINVPAKDALYMSLKKLTVEFTSEQATAAFNIREQWMADGKQGSRMSSLDGLVAASNFGDLAKTTSPFYSQAKVAFKQTLDALLGTDAQYAALRASVEARDGYDVYTSNLFKLHYLIVAFWFTATVLPLYMSGLLKGMPAKQPATIGEAFDLLFQTASKKGNGAATPPLNAFLSNMALDWSKMLMNLSASPDASEASVSEEDASQREAISPDLALNSALASAADDKKLPPMVTLLHALDVTPEKIFLKQLRLLAAYYVAVVTSGSGTRQTWDNVHQVVQAKLGYASQQDVIDVILAKGAPLSTSMRAPRNDSGNNNEEMLKHKTAAENMVKEVAEAVKQKKAAESLATSLQSLIGTLKAAAQQARTELSAAKQRNPAAFAVEEDEA